MNNKTTNSEQLKQAIEFHQQGQLDAASQLYQQILMVEPTHFDALHFSGVIEQQRGNPREAIRLIQQALQTVTTVFTIEHASAFCNLGSALNDIGAYQHGLNNLEIAIELKPNYAIAHNNRGNSLKHLGRIQQAITSYRTALLHQPNYSEAMYNCAVAYQSIDQHEQALQSLGQALHVRPNYPEAYFAQGLSLQSLQRFNEAIASYDCALEHRSNYHEAHTNKGIIFNKLGRLDEALLSFDRALTSKESDAKLHLYRANTLRRLERSGDAIEAYKRARMHGADQQHIDFVLATMGIGATPKAPPATYIKELFDQYADHFDEHLVGVLNYQTPQVLGQLIDQHRQSNQLITLDLGCGTGLCGPFLRPYSSKLVGVDLSPNMINQARKLDLYDELICTEIAKYMETANNIDVIVAADVFVYLGDLTRLFNASRAALNVGGLFCFSVEELVASPTESDFQLQTSCRYAHSEDYILRLSVVNNFDVLVIKSSAVRQENHTEIPALIVLLSKQ